VNSKRVVRIVSLGFLVLGSFGCQWGPYTARSYDDVLLTLSQARLVTEAQRIASSVSAQPPCELQLVDVVDQKPSRNGIGEIGRRRYQLPDPTFWVEEAVLALPGINRNRGVPFSVELLALSIRADVVANVRIASVAIRATVQRDRENSSVSIHRGSDSENNWTSSRQDASLSIENALIDLQRSLLEAGPVLCGVAAN